MLRLKTVSSLLVYGAGTLVFLVFILHVFTPAYQPSDSEKKDLAQQDIGDYFLRQNGKKNKATTTTSSSGLKTIPPPLNVECPNKELTVEQYRIRSLVRGVIIRFPSFRSSYYFVQFRWFYRSWIEAEMFTLDRWRTDIIVIIDDHFSSETRKSLEHLNCHVDNKRTARRQTSRCIIVIHKSFVERSEIERQKYGVTYQQLNRTSKLQDNVDRIFAIHDCVSQLNNNNQTMYDFIMVTTMNTFLTTQFGKYVPVKCAFLLGTSPDYSTWFGQTDQIIEFTHTLLLTLKSPFRTRKNDTTNFPGTIEILQQKFLFTENQVDIPCDSKITTYRTYVYLIKCYAHSTSLFSEKMFRQNAYDGYEKEPYNIYVAREYATLMALQSKVMTLDALRSLAVNVTRREVFT
ncbi:unnamed protein product [Adineta steineri]|uniref:DUF7164 domain-containing protein n=1 Tax=Adineta steineri TaxID=433720 RepID=A0A814J0S0_9BILA|nr:unnamed protein product [Adineta steineri]CAF3628190.1 unnamed protein product [Adineta steineri]